VRATAPFHHGPDAPGRSGAAAGDGYRGPPVDPGDARESRRRFRAGCAVGALAGTVSFAWLLTGGTWQLLQRNLYANFYDVQARAILHGHLSMPASTLTVEGIREGTRTYMYYGPVPALLRMPVLLLTHRFDGRLTICSMLVAFVVAMVFVSRLAWRIRALVTGAPVTTGEAVLMAVVLLVAGVGSQFFFLGSDALIYHEAELWGAACALGAFDFLVAFLVAPSRRSLLGSGLFAGLAILTRGSVGAGPVVALGVVGLVYGGLAAAAAVRARRAGVRAPVTGVEPGPHRLLARLGLPEVARRGAWATGLLVAAALPVVLYVVLNELKFHTLVSLPLEHQVFTQVNRNRRITLADNGGSLFGLKFVPTALVQYLRPDALSLSRLFPFLAFPPKAVVVGHVHYDTRDFSSSLTTSMPAVMAIGIVGLVAVFRRPRPGRGSLAALRLPVLGAAVGTVGVLTIAYVANRYLADFLPLLALTALAGLPVLRVAWRSWRPATRRLAAAALAVLALFGVWVNVGLALLYQRELRPSVPIVQRAGFVAFQQRLDTDLFGSDRPEVTEVAALPAPGPPGALAILGRCVALYQSDGSDWEAVERSQAAGHYRLRVVFPARAPGRFWPLLVNGTRDHADYLAVQPLGPGRIRFAYLFEGFHQGWVYGPAVSVTPGRPYVVDAVFDWRLPQVEAHLDGAAMLSARLVRPTATFDVGVDPLGGPAVARFPGGLRRLPVPTPTCSALLGRLDAAGPG